MIEIANLAVALGDAEADEGAEEAALRRLACRRLGVSPQALSSFELRRRSVDARKRRDVRLVYTVRLSLRDAEAEGRALARLRRRHADKNVRQVSEGEPYRLPERLGLACPRRPVVVGAGCAGLFCALSLAEAGLSPILVERGEDATRRRAAIRRFEETGELDPESNVQFGLGGAGTFSDGKLATGTKSPAHRIVLETLVEAGAQRRILWDAKPHIGSDVLPTVVTNLLARIEDLGGEVRLGERVCDVDTTGGRVRSVTLSRTDRATGMVVEEVVPADDVVLATGHSARDVYDLLARRGVALERKTFAMGVRIEHLQADVDRAQYGPFAGHPALGAAPYKLACHLPDGRSAFSFCMCPGGYVVAAASEAGGVCTNGMSLSDRAGTNANAGLLANVFPSDLPGTDVLAGVELQRRCERAAFEAGGGAYVAPAQLVGDFLAGRPSSGAGRVRPTYPRGVSWGSVEGCLPDYVARTLRAAIPLMARHLRGFDDAEAVLTGVETRSSSPVRITRTDELASVSTLGLWPCGEGAGYAGGIMSAATDGLRVADALTSSLARRP